MGLSAAPGAVHPFRNEVIQVIRWFDANQPRSLQRFMGPSEIGSPCMRQIGYKLAGTQPCNESADFWFAVIGTAVHDWLAAAMDTYQKVVLQRQRWLIEQRVPVAGDPTSYTTSGRSDVFDLDYGRVVDWKIVGTSSLRKYEQEGPSSDYRIQAHTYGKGWRQAGYDVKEVMNVYLPRSNFLSKTHVWCEPFDESVADAALARVGAIKRVVDSGLSPERLPAGQCSIWCAFYRPGVPLSATGCPGHGEILDD